MQKIILIGAGGHCKSCIDVIESENKYMINSILDREELVGEKVLNYRVTGTDELIHEFSSEYSFLITVGQILSPSIRIKLYSLVQHANGKLITAVSPSAHLSKYASLGAGTIVMHNAVINSDVKVGENCIINTLSNLEHDVVVGNHCHISTGAILNGGVNIGDNCFVGSGSIIAQNVYIAANTIIGAGSVVLRSIRQPGVYVGNPAKFFRNI